MRQKELPAQKEMFTPPKRATFPYPIYVKKQTERGAENTFGEYYEMLTYMKQILPPYKYK